MMLSIRRATPDDAKSIAALMSIIAAERIHSAIDTAWTTAEQRAYMEALPENAAIFIATAVNGQLAGLQTLELWSALPSMRHAAQLGTFLHPDFRRQGLGNTLFAHTRAFALNAGFTKLIIQVRASNLHAQHFYRRLGFIPCGRLHGQVRIDGVEDDEILLEMRLTPKIG